MNDTLIPPYPIVAPINAAKIPAVLKFKNQWALWKFTWNAEQGKWQKPPRLLDGSNASSTSPETWLPFVEALELYNAGGWGGLSFAPLPDDNLCFFDLDGCISEDGVINPEAVDVLKAMDTYTETSPSGSGLRVIACGHRPERNGQIAALGNGKVEIFDGSCKDGKPGGKFLTITGHCRLEFPTTIQSRQGVIDTLYWRLFARAVEAKPKSPRPLPMTDDEILKRAS
jgi:primase-polymerase (primpol)-like protein